MQQKLISKTRPRGNAGLGKLGAMEKASSPMRPESGAFGRVEQASSPTMAPHGMSPGPAPAHGLSVSAPAHAYMSMARQIGPMSHMSHGPVNSAPMHSCPYCGQPMP